MKSRIRQIDLYGNTAVISRKVPFWKTQQQKKSSISKSRTIPLTINQFLEAERQ